MYIPQETINTDNLEFQKVSVNIFNSIILIGWSKDGEKLDSVLTFNKVPGLSDIFKIIAGSHSAAINNKGKWFIWGVTQFGDFNKPTKIWKIFKDHKNAFDKIRNISIGYGFTMIVNKEGELYSWGNNKHVKLDKNEESFPLQSIISRSNVTI